MKRLLIEVILICVIIIMALLMMRGCGKENTESQRDSELTALEISLDSARHKLDSFAAMNSVLQSRDRYNDSVLAASRKRDSIYRVSIAGLSAENHRLRLVRAIPHTSTDTLECFDSNQIKDIDNRLARLETLIGDSTLMQISLFDRDKTIRNLNQTLLACQYISNKSDLYATHLKDELSITSDHLALEQKRKKRWRVAALVAGGILTYNVIK